LQISTPFAKPRTMQNAVAALAYQPPRQRFSST